MTPAAGAVLDSPPPSAEPRMKTGRRRGDADGEVSFLRAARPVLDQLALDLDGTSVGVVLTDAKGHALDVRGADGGNPLSVATRVDAPISHPTTGRVLGAVGLAALPGDGTALMLPLATRAAREIESRLLDETGLLEKLMLQRFIQERRKAKGPIVFIDERRMFTNAAAAVSVTPADRSRLWDCAKRLLSGEQSDPAELMLGGAAVEIRCEPVRDAGVPEAALLRLAPVAGATPESSPSRSVRRPYGWESLTESEEAVVGLVARGLTNREVGERLFISRHTVDFHLRSIFRKLDVGSRVGLTRIALQRSSSAA
jgi:DNA-binding CsgD family transcriptional regulator